MKSAACVVYSDQSATKTYAERFAQRWFQLFATRVELIDLCDLLRIDGFRMAMADSTEPELLINNNRKHIVMAFHPENDFVASDDEYLDHSLSAAYANFMIAGSCPNPPLVGQWGTHVTWLVSRRLLAGLGFPLTPVSRPMSSSLGFACLPMNNLFHSQNLQELEPPHLLKNDILILNKLRFADWRKQSRFVHSIGDEALVYDAAGNYRGDISPTCDFAALQKTLGTRVIELVGIASGNRLEFISFNPGLTLFPDDSLHALRSLL